MVDLKTLAEGRYRIALDESAAAESTRAERPWLYRIPCRYGFIAVHSLEHLAAYSGSPRLFAALLAVSGVWVRQRGDRELAIVFPPAQLERVAGILKAKRRMALSAEERARRAERAKSLRKPPLVAAP